MLVQYDDALAQSMRRETELFFDSIVRADRPVLDRWALSELQRVVREVDEAVEGFDPTRAGRALSRPQNWLELLKFSVVGATGYAVNLAVYVALPPCAV